MYRNIIDKSVANVPYYGIERPEKAQQKMYYKL